ncbi:hypothetical protein [Streptomyces sp. NBC_01361]|uniref:hypothetical protein n=1 Tax=Streptomyces sp. NBC_01361 TaxID=2903838 RepID=UPI002E35CB77|nr:hypothetical protein [Streptomyces sp. NBC_01361]
MSAQDVEARVDELARGLRRMAASLLEAAAEHPEAGRARELSAAARVLMNSVLARLDGDAGEGLPVDGGVSERGVQDSGPVPAETGSGLEELVGLYVSKYDRDLEDPVMTDPSLSYEKSRPLSRVQYAHDDSFEDAPLWKDAVPSRGKAVVRGMTTKAEVLRRMHHHYVLRRDLDGPEGELAVRVLLGCRAILSSQAVRGGDYFDHWKLERKLDALRWRAVVTAAERGAEAQAQLAEMLKELETLADAVGKLDTLFRRQVGDPSLAAGIPGVVRVVEAILQGWPKP